MDNLNAKTALVTGATGFIGRTLCTRLAACGVKVYGLTRKTSLAPMQNVHWINTLDQIKGVDINYIINLAGEPIAQRWTTSAKRKIRASRIDTTAAIVDFIRNSVKKPELLISGSAIGYYGTDANSVFSEETPVSTGAPFSRKLCADWEADAAQAANCGVRTVMLRTGAVLGKDGGMLKKMLPSFMVGLGGPIGHGHQWLSWIEKDDLINLIMHIISTPSLSGPVNATAPNPVTNSAFSIALAKSLHRPSFMRTPAFVLRTVFADMADEIMLEGQRVIPRKALDSGFSFACPDIDSAMRKIFNSHESR